MRKDEYINKLIIGDEMDQSDTNKNKTIYYCPKCSRELYTDGMVYTSMPPKMRVECRNCTYSGFRIMEE